MLKDPPPNFLSPHQKEKNTNAKKKAPLPSSFQNHDRRQETFYHHHSNGSKSPPQIHPPLSTLPQKGTEDQKDHRGLRIDRQQSSLRARPTRARARSIPRAIDVDVSYGNCFYDENDSNHPPPLSPISFSSSMFLKRVPVDNYYPSRDIIEKQIPDLPPRTNNFPTIVAPYPLADSPPSDAHKRTSMGTAPLAECREGVAATVIAAHHRTDARPTNTAAAALPTRTMSTMYKNRPEKPLRINSQFPSQLQLRQQQQQQQQRRQLQELEEERIQLQQEQKVARLSHSINQKLNSSSRSIDTYDSLVPCPLPTGNGLTNGVATGIDAIVATRCHPPKAFVPPAQDQEYDLQFPLRPSTSLTAASQSAINHNDGKRIGDTTATVDESSFLHHPQQSVVKVEIYPGVCQVLRGARETARAAKRDFVVNCACLVCTVEFSAIADANFVICPTCLVVNTLGVVVTTTDAMRLVRAGRWGVGLGFIPDHQ